MTARAAGTTIPHVDSRTLPALNVALEDGIDLLPAQPGIYCFLNRCNGRRWVGMASRSIRDRAMQHRNFFRRPSGPETHLLRDLRQHGSGAFIFLALELCPPCEGRNHRIALQDRERWWAEQLLSLDEGTGYNLEAGGVRSPASRFRDHERKLIRARVPKYQLLPLTDAAAPIDPALLTSWLNA